MEEDSYLSQPSDSEYEDIPGDANEKSKEVISFDVNINLNLDPQQDHDGQINIDNIKLEVPPEPLNEEQDIASIETDLIEDKESDDELEVENILKAVKSVRNEAMTKDPIRLPSQADNLSLLVPDRASLLAQSSVSESSLSLEAPQEPQEALKPEWMKYSLPPLPEVDDSEIIHQIDDEFEISKLIRQMKLNLSSN